MPSLEDAIILAVEAHSGQLDKAGQSYVLHPLRVMLDLASDVERIVGILHDVVEDTRDREPARRISLERLRSLGYSTEVLDALDCVTRRPGESYDAFIGRLKPNPVARRVKLADLADNLDVTRLRALGNRDLERLNRYLQAWCELGG